ncbi:MAG: DUF4150 domain-containing protein [Desulfovibrionaceae bacterium]|nr:DUF4150 domain-containing protein [Desulfovibrionaceae bacterium]
MGNPAMTNMGGMFTATTPDVCKTPTPGSPVPIPYPNISQGTMLDVSSLAKKVQICGGKPALVTSSTMLSNGDEAGTAGGVASSKFIGKTEFTSGSVKVRIEGKSAVRLGDPTTQNEKNTAGMATAPSQTKVFLG